MSRKNVKPVEDMTVVSVSTLTRCELFNLLMADKHISATNTFLYKKNMTIYNTGKL